MPLSVLASGVSRLACNHRDKFDIMVRTQIQLTEEQARKLKRLAVARGQSLAQLIRLSVDALLAQPEIEITPEERRRRALAIIGRLRSGISGIAADHDRYLAEAYWR